MQPVQVVDLEEYDYRALDSNLVTAKQESMLTKAKVESDQMAKERAKASQTKRVSTL